MKPVMSVIKARAFLSPKSSEMLVLFENIASSMKSSGIPKEVFDVYFEDGQLVLDGLPEYVNTFLTKMGLPKF